MQLSLVSAIHFGVFVVHLFKLNNVQLLFEFALITMVLNYYVLHNSCLLRSIFIWHLHMTPGKLEFGKFGNVSFSAIYNLWSFRLYYYPSVGLIYIWLVPVCIHTLCILKSFKLFFFFLDFLIYLFYFHICCEYSTCIFFRNLLLNLWW